MDVEKVLKELARMKANCEESQEAGRPYYQPPIDYGFLCGLIAAIEHLQAENAELVDGSYRTVNDWLSAALSDERACEEFKTDIREWFDAISKCERPIKKVV